MNFCLVPSFAQAKAETVEAVIKKASQKFKTEQYLTYNIKYSLYNNQESNVVNESYTGIFLKKNDVLYYKIKNTEFIGFSEYSVKINKDERAMIIAKGANNEVPLDLNNFLKGFKYKFIGNDKTNYICELIPNKVTQFMFSKVLLYINKQNFNVYKQVLFYVNPTDETNTASKPKMEIIFTPRARNEVSDNFLVDEKNYFIKINKEIKAASRFKDYKLYKA